MNNIALLNPEWVDDLLDNLEKKYGGSFRLSTNATLPIFEITNDLNAEIYVYNNIDEYNHRYVQKLKYIDNFVVDCKIAKINFGFNKSLLCSNLTPVSIVEIINDGIYNITGAVKTHDAQVLYINLIWLYTFENFITIIGDKIIDDRNANFEVVKFSEKIANSFPNIFLKYY